MKPEELGMKMEWKENGNEVYEDEEAEDVKYDDNNKGFFKSKIEYVRLWIKGLKKG